VGQENIMHPFEIGAAGQVQLNDDLPCRLGETGRIADRRRRHDMALLGDRHRFNHRNIPELSSSPCPAAHKAA